MEELIQKEYILLTKKINDIDIPFDEDETEIIDEILYGVAKRTVFEKTKRFKVWLLGRS